MVTRPFGGSKWCPGYWVALSGAQAFGMALSGVQANGIALSGAQAIGIW